jgi:hypothetical protein
MRCSASILLGLLAICAPARAQQLADARSAQLAGDAMETPFGIEWSGADQKLFGDFSDGARDAAPPQRDLFSGLQIDWAGVFPNDVLVAPARPGFSQQQPAPPPPTPAHTGFKALVFETGSDFNAFPRRTSTWVILAIGGGAAAIVHPRDKQVTQAFADSEAAGRFFVAGKYIGSDYVQAGAAIGLYVIGRYVMPHAEGEPKTNKVSHLGFDLLRALIVSQAFTQAIKVIVQRDRPTGECCSFPSGHSSATFATASVLERHLGYRGAWPTFAIAGYVAMSRLHDDRHFLSDVIFGGALGIASGWTVVGRHGRSNYAMMPVAIPGGFMVSFSRNPSPRWSF